MGQILTQLLHERRILPELEFFADKSLSKIQQYYYIYKNISDTFAIDDTEFKDIFGELHPVFDILDTNSSLLIDGLQLFTAMPLFSKLISLQDKIQFIFKLFDFNELKSLSCNDIQFMILTCYTATHKLLGIKSQLKEDIAISFANQQFGSIQRRINISQVKKWAITSQIVTKFVDIVRNEQQKQVYSHIQQQQIKSIKTLLSDKLYRSYNVCFRNQLGSLLARSSQALTSRKSMQREAKKWLVENRKLIDYESMSKTGLKQAANKNPQQSDIIITPNWIYGIRYKDVKYFMQFAHQNEIMYFVGRTVVILNIKSLRQRHYFQHDYPVICLTSNKNTHKIMNNDSCMVASSQMIQADDLCEHRPAIRVWNPFNLKTIAIIKGHHKVGIHLLKFTNSGSYLVSCGLVFYSPVVVYSVKQNFKCFYSVSCLHPSVQISPIYGIIDKASDDFVVCTLYGVKYFEVNEKTQKNIQTVEINCIQLKNNESQKSDNIYQYGQFSPITCSAFVYVNQNYKYLSGYDVSQQKMIITGHEKGEVIIWSTSYKAVVWELCNESNEIVSIIPFTNFILIASNSSIINFYDVDLRNKKKLFQIDLTTLDIQLRGYDLTGIIMRPSSQNSSLCHDFRQSQFIVSSNKGEFFLLSLNQKQDHSLRYKLIGPRYECVKISKIIQIGQITTQKLLQRQNQQNLLIFGGCEGILSIVNANSRMLTEKWKIGQPIIAMDCIQFKQDIYIVVGTTSNRVYSSLNFIERNSKLVSQRAISCLKLIIDSGHVVLVEGMEGGYLHFINTEENGEAHNNRSSSNQGISRKKSSNQLKIEEVGQQFNKNRVLGNNLLIPNANTIRNEEQTLKQNSNVYKKIKLASTPTEIINLQKKMLLVATEDNIFYLISLKDYFYKVIQPEKTPFSAQLIKNKAIKFYYCVKEASASKRKNEKKMVKLPLILGKHEKLAISANPDCSISIWKNLSETIEENRLKFNWHSSICCNFAIDNDRYKFYSSGTSDGMVVESELLKFYEYERSVIKPSRTLVSAESMQALANQNLNSQSIQENSSSVLPLMEKQIQFCSFNNEITTQNYDQHILVRGLENETLARMFRGMSDQWKILNKEISVNSIPRISLKLDYVFGLQTDNKRSTVFAISIPYTQFIYFVSNLVVVYDPTTNTQKLYKGHRYKITCISKLSLTKKHYYELSHQKQQIASNEIELIASAQSSMKPVIKIWNPINLQTIRTISTVHNGGIIQICCNSQTIFSYGIANKSQKLFSLQLSQIKSGRSIASRQLKQLIYSIAINPMKSNQLVTTGKHNVTIWKAVENNIHKFSVVQTNKTVTCCIYRLVEQPQLQYFGNRSENARGFYSEEIIVGTQNGDLGLVIGLSKYKVIEQKAHQKSINCIQFVNSNKLYQSSEVRTCDNAEQNFIDKFKNKNIKYIVTCSQDQTLKVWSKNFKIQFDQDIRRIQFEERSFLNHNNSSFNSNANNNQLYANQKLNANNLSAGSALTLNNQKVLSKNVSVQSISSIIDKYDNQLCLLLATRNGDVLIMKQSDYGVKRTYEQNKKSSRKKSYDLRDSSSQIIAQQSAKNQRKARLSKSSSKGLKLTKKAINAQQKSSFITRQPVGSKKRLRLKDRGSVQMSPLYIQNEKKQSMKNTEQQIQGDEGQKQALNSIEAVKFILYLRGHSSQISTSTRSSFINKKQIGGKVLFAHHPRFDLVATLAEDQNLMFWDTERNILILNRMLGYFAQPTALKFTKDGQILIIGYSDGRLMFLDSTLSKSHQGKGDEKYVLPSLNVLMENRNNCPVLAIQQSQSGDHIAVSYNNRSSRIVNKNEEVSNKNSQTQSAHICIFLNKSRDKMRGHTSNKMEHNALFENVTTIPCQSDSIYATQNNNKYGMATHSMMFTESEGKTYLLIYEQLTDAHSQNKLNCNKDGNYIIWDVNTSTMIANLDQISGLNWKKISVPNSIYARYQMYGSLTLNQQFSSTLSSNPNTNLLIPYFSAMLNLPNHLILGSVNGDIHIAQTSCLEYQKMIQSFPRRKEMFPAKTYPGHCSQIYHMEFNQDRSVLYTSGISDKCVLKWKIEGDLNMYSVKTSINSQNHSQNNNIVRDSYGIKAKPIFNYFGHSNLLTTQKQQQIMDEQQVDLFKEVPQLEDIQKMLECYNEKYRNSWVNNFTLANEANSQSSDSMTMGQANIKNITDFVQTIRVLDIVGRRAHDMRYNLWYDCSQRILYSSGHAIVILKPKHQQSEHQFVFNYFKNNMKQVENKKSILVASEQKRIDQKEFLHLLNGNGVEPSQQISCTYLSGNRKLVFTGHNGLMGTICVWDASTKLRLKTIIIKNIVNILMIRTSDDNSTAIVYGINEIKQAFLMLVCLASESVLGVANFVHQNAWHIKDIAYYPASNHRFVTCGINQTMSWKLMGSQLTYSILSCTSTSLEQQQHNMGVVQNSVSPSTVNKSVSICIAFLPKSWRIVTGCEDGNLLFWGENSFQRREHSDMIMVLKPCQPNILLSGSRDGTILLWIEQSNSSGLILCSKLNLRNQSVSLFKPHGASLYLKGKHNYNQNEFQSSNIENQLVEAKRKGKQTTMDSQQKLHQNVLNSKYNQTKNLTQQSIYQQLSIQSLDIFKVFGQLQQNNILKVAEQQQKISKFPQRRNRNTTLDRQIKQVADTLGLQKEKSDNAGDKKMNSVQVFNPQKWRVLIGTTCGDIYETTFSQQTKNKIDFDENCQLIEAYHDNQIPKSFFFSKSDQEIYQITSKGYFCCRSISDCTLIFEQNFSKQTVEMIYSPKNDRFYIIFKSQIRSYQMLQKLNTQDAQLARLKPLASLQLKQITHAEISAHQKVLALGVTKTSDKSVSIELYDISKSDEIKYLINFAMPANENIQYIDFSKNNKVVLIKLISGKIVAQQLITLQNYSHDLIQFTEWTNFAQNLYDLNCKIRQKIQNILFSETLSASEDNSSSEATTILIKQVADNVFIVINEQGNIYAFNSDIQLIGQSFLKISNASIIKFSHSKKLLGIGSQIDRNIAIFDIQLLQTLKGYE